jgi:hypothetical protein
VQFLLMASISDYVLGFWGSLAAGALAAGLLTYLLFRGHPSRRLLYGLVFFFTLVYPLSGLIGDLGIRNSFDGLVRVGMIIYLFVLALQGHLQSEKRKPVVAEQQAAYANGEA